MFTKKYLVNALLHKSSRPIITNSTTLAALFSRSFITKQHMSAARMQRAVVYGNGTS